MGQKSQTRQTGAAKATKDIRRAARKQCSTEENICVVLDGQRGEETISELCRREGIAQDAIINGRRSFWKRACVGLSMLRTGVDVSVEVGPPPFQNMGLIYIALRL